MRKNGYGRGQFVQIYHEGFLYKGKELYSLFMQLSEVSADIPYFDPVFDPVTKDCDTSRIFAVPPEKFKQGAKFVPEGFCLGKVGFTGLGIGDGEVPHNPPLVTPQSPTWSQPQVHWETAFRDPATGKRTRGPDPFEIYGSTEAYSDVFEIPHGLILRNSDGTPKFANQT